VRDAPVAERSIFLIFRRHPGDFVNFVLGIVATLNGQAMPPRRLSGGARRTSGRRRGIADAQPVDLQLANLELADGRFADRDAADLEAANREAADCRSANGKRTDRRSAVRLSARCRR